MGRWYNPDDFVTQYPGVYPEKIKGAMDEFFAVVEKINSTEVTGADVVAGKVTEPKLSGKFTLTEEMAHYFNEKYAPDYKLNLDKETAKRYGYKDIFAMLGMTASDECYNFMPPRESRDTVLVSQISSEIENFRPFYVGDTIYMVRDKVEVHDLTPDEGSVYRHVHTKNYGTVYNQNGEVVTKCMFSLMESTKTYKDECLPKARKDFGFPDFWEDPDWRARPMHKYTDKDYDKLKEIWKNEINRKDEILYWEDAKLGEFLPLGTFGVIKDGVIPLYPYGMGVGGSRNLKEYFLNPETEKQMITDAQTGIKLMPNPEINTPKLPEGIELPKMDTAEPPKEGADVNTADVHGGPELRNALLNLFGRDVQIAYVEKYAGYHGRVKGIKWNIMPADTHAALGKRVPVFPDYVNYLKKVPGKANETQTAHGLTTDAAIVHGYVYKKDVVGEDFVLTLLTWIEDMDANPWSSAQIDIVLPSKNKK
ncbi:MAG: hypothetical protein K6B15_03755 [Parasporobacterium sp.]|nr:hypothetical protein [Parasporobacterium sp.]